MKLNNAITRMDLDKFNLLMKYGSRDETALGINTTTLIDLEWGQVKMELPGAFEENDFEKIIMIVAGVKRKQAGKFKLKKALPFIFFVYDDLKKLSQMEKDYLTSLPDKELKAAGVDQLNELGEINTIDYLAGGNILEWDAVIKIKYSMVFDKLRKNKLDYDIAKERKRQMK